MKQTIPNFNVQPRNVDQMVTDVIELASNIMCCFKQSQVGSNGNRSTQGLDRFYVVFSDFMVLQAESRISLMCNMHNNNALEGMWQNVQDAYAAVPDKSSHVIDLWKTMSSKVSQLLYVKQLG